MNKVSRTLVAAALVVTPIALASPAQARTANGCTVTPFAPHAVGHTGSNEVKVDYAVRVSCRPAHTSRHVHVQEEQRESDNNYQSSQLTGRAALNFDFPAAGGSTTAYIHTILPRTEPNNEEMYQRTRFKVTADGVQSAYTAWESSGISWIWH